MSKTNPMLSIEETPYGPVISICGDTVKVVKLYGLLTQSILQNTAIPRRVLEMSVDISVGVWAKLSDNMTTIDMSQIRNAADKLSDD